MKIKNIVITKETNLESDWLGYACFDIDDYFSVHGMPFFKKKDRVILACPYLWMNDSGEAFLIFSTNKNDILSPIYSVIEESMREWENEVQ
tara:strand:- start:3920 stop:4192 length:273 start_codon:yes stop_codon:yes gene_type:complete